MLVPICLRLSTHCATAYNIPSYRQILIDSLVQSSSEDQDLSCLVITHQIDKPSCSENAFLVTKYERLHCFDYTLEVAH